MSDKDSSCVAELVLAVPLRVAARRGALPCVGDITRGGTAERAVAPREIELGTAEETPDDGRRGAGRVEVVAMMIMEYPQGVISSVESWSLKEKKKSEFSSELRKSSRRRKPVVSSATGGSVGNDSLKLHKNFCTATS